VRHAADSRWTLPYNRICPVTQPEYIAAFLSIIAGLGVTDLAQSLCGLVHPRRTVNWHWLPLVWAATTFLLAIQVRWNSFSTLTDTTAEYFLPYLLTFSFLYLTCAFALPDPDGEPRAIRSDPSRPGTEDGGAQGRPSVLASTPEPPVQDLRAFYFSATHRQWYFGIFAAFLIAAQVGLQTANLPTGDGVDEFEVLINGLFAALVGVLILTDRWWVHAPISVFSVLLVGWTTVNSILGLV
jgi:hypothetical protein